MPDSDQHPFTRFVSQKGHFPRIRIRNDEDEWVEVSFSRSSVMFTFYGKPGYGNAHHRTFYITRNAWIRILKHAVKMAPLMDQNHSVGKAVKRWMKEEKRHLEEFRRQKKGRYRPK